MPNPTMRMKGTTTSKDGNKTEDIREVVEKSIDVEKGAEIHGEEATNADLPPIAKPVPEVELLKDLDMDQFYFTGKIEHTFKIGKLEVVFGLLDAEELEATNKILWELASESSSTDMLLLSHSIEILGRTIIKYGKKVISSMSSEDRIAFVRKNIPGVLIPILIRKYAILEASATAAFEDDDLLKN